MARRYAKVHPIHLDENQHAGGGIGDPTGANFPDGAGGIWGVSQRNSGVFTMCAPSRYSNVRKVIFWMAVTYRKGDVNDKLNVRLAVGPSNQIDTGINIDTVTLAPGGELAQGVDNVPWDFFPNETHSTPASSKFFATNMLYTKRGDETVLQGEVPLPATAEAAEQGDVQMVELEFDRFNPDSEDFFTDWDTVAAQGDDDQYVGYSGWLSVRLSTWDVSDEDRTKMLTFGMTIVQAPGPSNDTCTIIGVGQTNSHPLQADSSRRTSYLVDPNDAYHVFNYVAGDWDGITSITGLFRGLTGLLTAGQFGNWKLIRQGSPDVDLTSGTYSSAISTGTPAEGTVLYRTPELLSFFTEDGQYWIDYFQDGIAANLTGKNPWFFEIIQKNCTKSVFLLDNSTGKTDDGTITILDGDSGKGACFFDPLWFEDYVDDDFLRRRMWGTLLHVSGSNLARFDIRHDDDLDSNDARGFTSATALTMGGQFNSSGMSPPFPASRFQEFAISTNDPMNLAGKRKIYINAGSGGTWLAGAGESMFTGVLYYAHIVHNTEVVELGPIFDLDAFEPEGCASTSAGLGDPGLLVITNGSSIPQHYNPAAGVIEDNGIPAPFCDEVPSTQTDDIGASPTRGLGLGTYRYRYTFRNCCTGKESNPNPDDIVVDTSGQSPAAQVTLSFAGVRIPGDTQICEICVYRTLLSGDFPVMAKVGCFDPDETTLFVDDVADAALDFINESISQLNGIMPCVPVVAEFRNRLFGMGDIPQLSPVGTVSVVEGSDIVTGDDNVVWDRCLEGKFIQIEGDCRSYEIEKVLPPVAGTSPPIGRLKLVDEYEGVDGTGLSYTICGRPNRLYFSEPLEPECWPEINFIDVEPGDGDRLMGAASNFNRLVICKRNKTYVLTFRENPLTEVVVPTRISSDIGCIGPRTFAQVENGTVWLADRGLAIFDGRGVQHVPESVETNDIFIDPDNPRYVRRDRNGRVIGAVGVFYPKREQYLLLLPTVQTSRGANLMLVWDVKLKNITLLEFCQEFLSMVVAKDSDGNERVYMGDTNGFVWLFDIGTNDGVGYPNQTGTVRGTVTDSGIHTSGASFLDDSTASFIEGGLPNLAELSGVAGLTPAFDGDTMGLAGVCLYTRAAGANLDDPWTVRTVFAATATRLFITPSWGDDQPAVGDDYMLGAIDFTVLFKPSNYGTDDMLKRDWKQILTFDPQEISSQLRVELLPDLQLSDPDELTVVSGEPPTTGSGRVFDMSFSRGRMTKPVGRLIHNYMGVRMKNFAPDEPIKVINHILAKTPRTSK